jgi:hypothetical protein
MLLLASKYWTLLQISTTVDNYKLDLKPSLYLPEMGIIVMKNNEQEWYDCINDGDVRRETQVVTSTVFQTRSPVPVTVSFVDVALLLGL